MTDNEVLRYIHKSISDKIPTRDWENELTRRSVDVSQILGRFVPQLIREGKIDKIKTSTKSDAIHYYALCAYVEPQTELVNVFDEIYKRQLRLNRELDLESLPAENPQRQPIQADRKINKLSQIWENIKKHPIYAGVTVALIVSFIKWVFPYIWEHRIVWYIIYEECINYFMITL
jgi:hypothetical protein